MWNFLFLVLVLVLASSAALADAAPDCLKLKNGDSLCVQIESETESQLQVVHPQLGPLTIARESLAPAEPVIEAVPEVVIEPVGWLAGWQGNLDAGVKGSDGNTEQMSARVGLDGKRTSSTHESRLGFVYDYETADGSSTKNRFKLNGRQDWLLENSRWRRFASGAATHDQFEDYDWLLEAALGLGYEFFKTPEALFLGRAGIGFSKRIGAEDDDVTPELLLGVDYERQINDRQKFVSGLTWYPSLESADEYRIEANATWQLLVDPESGMSLKLGIEDRYDNNPGEGVKHNDLDYMGQLSWPLK